MILGVDIIQTGKYCAPILRYSKICKNQITARLRFRRRKHVKHLTAYIIQRCHPEKGDETTLGLSHPKTNLLKTTWLPLTKRNLLRNETSVRRENMVELEVTTVRVTHTIHDARPPGCRSRTRMLWAFQPVICAEFVQGKMRIRWSPVAGGRC
jgi:hypothetical protein